MPKRLAALLLLLCVAVAGACAGRTQRGGPEPVSRDVLTRQQMERVHAISAFDAVQRLRSNWMRPRGVTQMPGVAGVPQFRENQVVVYLDDQRLGGPEQLRDIEIAAVQYIRRYSAAEASARWGLNHGGGAIYVSTRPAQR